MFPEEIDLHIKLCNLKSGDKALLPPYMLRLTVNYISGSNKDKIITFQLLNTEYYDGYCVPLPTTLLNTIKKIKRIFGRPRYQLSNFPEGANTIGISSDG